MPEINITIKVNICSRCYHLWERRRGVSIENGNNQPMVCPSCNSPYWNKPKKPREKGKKKNILLFHGEKVLDSNIGEIPL